MAGALCWNWREDSQTAKDCVSTITKELLQKFCCDKDGAEVLQSPTSQGNHTFATNRKFMLQVARLTDVPEMERFPNCKSVMQMWTQEGEWKVLSAFQPFSVSEVLPCKNCGGTGTHTCKQCECHHECGKCDGAGEIKQIRPQRVGERCYDGDLLQLISSLPAVEINISGSKTACGSFRFEGGIGVIMPMKDHED